jgi:hypothetical protein
MIPRELRDTGVPVPQAHAEAVHENEVSAMSLLLIMQAQAVNRSEHLGFLWDDNRERENSPPVGPLKIASRPVMPQRFAFRVQGREQCCGRPQGS